MTPRQWWEVFGLDRSTAATFLRCAKSIRECERQIGRWVDKATRNNIHPHEIVQALIEARQEALSRWGGAQ